MSQRRTQEVETLGLLPDTTAGTRQRELEKYVGAEIRKLRRRANMTVLALAQHAGISQGMMSKIEGGQTSASLSTLAALAKALGVPLAALFARLDSKRDVSYVRANQGLIIDRRGTQEGHIYELLGHGIRSSVGVEPYMITLDEGSEGFTDFQHEGIEFIYMIQGELVYRHGSQSFRMKAGDALLFDAIELHGPLELIEQPCRYLSVIVYPRYQSGE